MTTQLLIKSSFFVQFNANAQKLVTRSRLSIFKNKTTSILIFVKKIGCKYYTNFVKARTKIMRFSKAVVKHRKLILLISILLMIPSVLGIMGTRINYDMLKYLPTNIDTIKGQDILLDDFGKGAFSLITIENMNDSDVKKLCSKFEKVDHVETVLWYSNLSDVTIPKEFLPDNIYDKFNNDETNATMVAVFFNTSTSDDETMEAIKEIRSIGGNQCFVSGMSALVTDLKDLCEKEEPIYVGLAVLCATAAMLLLLDGWLIPFIFLTSIGMMIMLNLGSNYFFGEISYITKALSAVLQLAVTMDYSIFVWHSYNENIDLYDTHEEAMEVAIKQTLSSVVGSSITTVAGFLALCFMSFTLGRDLGVVMAKGVLLGVIGCVTVLPALILTFDKPLHETGHKGLIPDTDRISTKMIKIFPAFIVLFVLLIPPALYGYQQTNDEVYYDLGDCLPQDINYAISNKKLAEDFDIASTHMVLVDSSTSSSAVRSMSKDIEKVDGVKYVLGMESVVGSDIPTEMIPDGVKDTLDNGDYELLLVNSEYKVASSEVNSQITEINKIVKNYDDGGMLIGEAPCMRDMIKITDRDFKVVNIISVLAIFIIIALVEGSISLPFILIAVIELAICINLGLSHYFGQPLPFIAPICISTIQLGATVDYAILMTTRYKKERIANNTKRDSVHTALSTSIPSIIVSGVGLFAATFGVAVYSDIDIISSMCSLMARGAVISMLCVILILPALLMLCDKVICKTTRGMKHVTHDTKLMNSEAK